MKGVLISIQPKYVGKIASGGKTIEVRKTRPKLETPFKCYIYMTQGKLKDLGTYSDWFHLNRMKVIGKFVCDRIEKISCYIEAGEYNEYLVSDQYLQNCKLSYTELYDHLNGKDGYGWHISDLKIYDKPKELGEFGIYEYEWFEWYGEDQKVFYPLKRPPQSWCYVESKY